MKNLQEETIKSIVQFSTMTEELELINGEFSSKDAQEILLQLFGDKIKYHQLRNLSSLERFGEFDVISTKRLPELQQQEQKIKEIFQNKNLSGATFKIQATINIEIAG